jgi:hypothetical protein
MPYVAIKNRLLSEAETCKQGLARGPRILFLKYTPEPDNKNKRLLDRLYFAYNYNFKSILRDLIKILIRGKLASPGKQIGPARGLGPPIMKRGWTNVKSYFRKKIRKRGN